MGASPTAPQALGTPPVDDVRRCMFCGTPLANRHEAFMTHLGAAQECKAAHEAWLERLDQDRPGG